VEMTNQKGEVNRFQGKICLWAMTYALALAFIFLFFHEKAIAKGIVLGTCFSIINFFLMGKSIYMILGRSRAKANAMGLMSILSRYFFLAIPLIIGIKYASFNFVAVVVGIFAVQIVILVNHIVVSPTLSKR